MASVIESVTATKNPTSKFVTSDPAVFKQRMQAYNDSLYAFKNLSTKMSPQKAYGNLEKIAAQEGGKVPYDKPHNLSNKEKKDILKDKTSEFSSYKGIAPVKKMSFNAQNYLDNIDSSAKVPVYNAYDRKGNIMVDENNRPYIAENLWYKEPTQLPVLQESDSPKYADPFYMASKAIQNIPLSKASELSSLPEIVAQKTEKVAEVQANPISSLATMPADQPKQTPAPQQPSKVEQGQRKPDYGRQLRNAAGEKSTRAKLIDLVYDEQGGVKDQKLYDRYKNDFAKMNADQNYLMNTSLLP